MLYDIANPTGSFEGKLPLDIRPMRPPDALLLAITGDEVEGVGAAEPTKESSWWWAAAVSWEDSGDAARRPGWADGRRGASRSPSMNLTREVSPIALHWCSSYTVKWVEGLFKIDLGRPSGPRRALPPALAACFPREDRPRRDVPRPEWFSGARSSLPILPRPPPLLRSPIEPPRIDRVPPRPLPPLRRSTLDRICVQLSGGYGKDGVVVFGAATCSSGFGYFPAPVKGLRRRLEHHTRVVVLDEHYTSKRCSKCAFKKDYEQCKDVLLPGRSRTTKTRQIYGVRFCPHSDCHTTWNRDVNAARNMRMVFLKMLKNDKVRPEPFKHEGALSK